MQEHFTSPAFIRILQSINHQKQFLDMNKSSATIMAAALMLASSCTEVKQEGQGYEPIIGKQEITIKDGRLTPEALWAMGRIGSLSISPDGKR